MVVFCEAMALLEASAGELVSAAVALGQVGPASCCSAVPLVPTRPMPRGLCRVPTCPNAPWSACLLDDGVYSFVPRVRMHVAACSVGHVLGVVPSRNHNKSQHEEILCGINPTSCMCNGTYGPRQGTCE